MLRPFDNRFMNTFLFIFIFVIKISTFIIVETVNENLIFINPKNNNKWIYPIEYLVLEHDRQKSNTISPIQSNQSDYNIEVSKKYKNEISIPEIEIKNSIYDITKKEIENNDNICFSQSSLQNIIKKHLEDSGKYHDQIDFNTKTLPLKLIKQFKNKIFSEEDPGNQIIPTNIKFKKEKREYLEQENLLRIRETFLENIIITDCGKLVCFENSRFKFISRNLNQILENPFFYKNILFTASRRTINYQMEIESQKLMVIINIFYIQMFDTRRNLKRNVKFHRIFAPIYQVRPQIHFSDKNVQYFDREFSFKESIRFLYTTELLNEILFFSKIISGFEEINNQNPSQDILKKILIILFLTHFILYFLQYHKNVYELNLLNIKKDIKYTIGIFNNRKVIIKNIVKDDSRIENEISILSFLNDPSFLKYTFIDKNRKYTQMIRDVCGENIIDMINKNETNNYVEQIQGTQASSQSEFSQENDTNFDTTKSIENNSTLRESVMINTFDEYILFKKRISFSMDLFYNIVKIFEKLHALNIAYCNVCPENIFYKENIVYLANFEECFCEIRSSKEFIKKILNFKSEEQNIIGSDDYRSPEIIKFNNKKLILDLETCKKSDVFSLALIFHKILFNKNPFENGDLSVEENIIQNIYTLNKQLKGPIVDLIHHMLKSDINKRLNISAVSKHPAFWNNEKIYNFFATLSDLLEFRGEISRQVYTRLERNKTKAFYGSWMDKLNDILKEELVALRIYNFNNVKGLLRVIRNKGRHYNETNADQRLLFGSFPNGFIDYFMEKFPNLLMVSYYSGKIACQDELLSKFY